MTLLELINDWYEQIYKPANAAAEVAENATDETVHAYDAGIQAAEVAVAAANETLAAIVVGWIEEQDQRVMVRRAADRGMPDRRSEGQDRPGPGDARVSR